MSKFIPLIAPKHLSQYSPIEYFTYVRSLHREPERAAPPAEFTVSVNKKGTVVLRINRKPKYLTPSEVDKIAQQLGWKKQEAWLMIREKKVEVKR